MSEELSSGVRRFTRFILAILLVGPLGCTSNPSTSDRGTHHVDNLPVLVLEEAGRIGSVDDPDYGFSSIGSVNVDRDGNLFLFESRDRQIRVYSRDGELIRRLGGSGDGPGEFSSSSIVWGVKGDTVWAYDSQANRLTVFDRFGQLLEATLVEQVRMVAHDPQQSFAIQPSLMGLDGLLIGDRGMMVMTESAGEVASVDTIHVPRVRFDLQGDVVDTLGFIPVARSPSAELITVGSSRYPLPLPPGIDRITRTAPEGLIFVDQGSTNSQNDFRITRLDHHGDTLRVTTLEYDPKPFPAAVLDATAARNVRVGMIMMAGTVEGIVRLEQTREDSAAAVAEIRQRMEFPEYQHPVRSVLVTSNGTLWLQREHRSDDRVLWTVLDNEDRPVGEISLASRQRIGWTDGRTVWMIEPDEFDVPWLVLYELKDP